LSSGTSGRAGDWTTGTRKGLDKTNLKPSLRRIFREASLATVSAVDDRFDFRTYDLVAVHFRLLRYAESVPMSSVEQFAAAGSFSEKTVSDNCAGTGQTGCLLDGEAQSPL